MDIKLVLQYIATAREALCKFERETLESIVDVSWQEVAAIHQDFNERNIINTEDGLTPNELEVVRIDWLSNVRYQRHGKNESSDPHDKLKAGTRGT